MIFICVPPSENLEILTEQTLSILCINCNSDLQSTGAIRSFQYKFDISSPSYGVFLRTYSFGVAVFLGF